VSTIANKYAKQFLDGYSQTSNLSTEQLAKRSEDFIGRALYEFDHAKKLGTAEEQQAKRDLLEMIVKVHSFFSFGVR
jgi:hypothetical protein